MGNTSRVGEAKAYLMATLIITFSCCIKRATVQDLVASTGEVTDCTLLDDGG